MSNCNCKYSDAWRCAKSTGSRYVSCQCACHRYIDKQPKVSRRGFISMLGAGAIVAVASKVLTEKNLERVITDMQLENGDFGRVYRIEFTNVYYDAERQIFIAEDIPASRVYTSLDGSTWNGKVDPRGPLHLPT